ncbi:hypothetical protein Htur_2615 [Haloterrigena turkmenica DSM 5511]|uniref:DUF7847 domain-containing protein n=1 Tax=Haloterrigena turkmenica (strain ATCC 51198 / DSM 5511 / JCM 9101 / NCIMB 13204 / VKM B-1734 / 4k) TaxID=543526 RepID=D2RWJ1_HALTV|nr:hypothetical protein [Haloterrigena turkmenica]ADB61492.1 hypothetical protein Htur_2615 [Haloterrigena turkmenica DSM 5511]
MTFNVSDTVTEAVERVTTSAAAVLIAALTVVGVAQTAALQDILRGFLEWTLEMLNDPEVSAELTASEIETAEEQINAYISELPLALGVSPGAAAVLWLAAFVVSLVIVAIAIDAFGNERDSLDGISTEGLGRKTLHLLLGWIAYSILVAIGFLLLVVPGPLVAFLLVFFTAAIVIDDESFISAFGSSYSVVRSNLLGTLAIVVLSIVAFVVFRFVGTIFAGVLPGVPGAIAADLITAVSQVFVLALLTRAYVNATTDDAADPVGSDSEWAADSESETRRGTR